MFIIYLSLLLDGVYNILLHEWISNKVCTDSYHIKTISRLQLTDACLKVTLRGCPLFCVRFVTLSCFNSLLQYLTLRILV